jgi:hypothetical protein
MSNALDAFADAFAAAAGGYFSCSVLFPLEIVKNKLQASQKSGLDEPTFFGIANEIYKEHGIHGFIDGVTVSAVGSSTEKFVYFYAYSFMRAAYENMMGSTPGPVMDLLVGYVCEFMHLPVSMPLDTLGVKIQTNKDPSLGVMSIVNKTVQETGVAGFYKGWQAYFGLAWKPAIQYAVFEQTKQYLLRTNGTMELSFAQVRAGLLKWADRLLTILTVSLCCRRFGVVLWAGQLPLSCSSPTPGPKCSSNHAGGHCEQTASLVLSR